MRSTDKEKLSEAVALDMAYKQATHAGKLVHNLRIHRLTPYYNVGNQRYEIRLVPMLYNPLFYIYFIFILLWGYREVTVDICRSIFKPTEL